MIYTASREGWFMPRLFYCSIMVLCISLSVMKSEFKVCDFPKVIEQTIPKKLDHCELSLGMEIDHTGVTVSLGTPVWKFDVIIPLWCFSY